MSDNTTADIIVTAQAGLTAIENKFATLARDSGSITPTTLTAMDGINQDLALRRHPHATTVITALKSAQSSNISAPNYHPDAATLNSIGNAMETQSDKQLVSNTQFGAMFSQATNHVEASHQLRLKTDFIANTSFPDYGSGITSMRDTLDQGMSSSFGDLNAAAKAMSATKGVYDTEDMKNYGTYTGLFRSMQTNKLANFSGLTANLEKYNIDPTMLDDPAYKDQVDAAFGSITDPTVLQTMADQWDLPTSTVTSPGQGVFNPFAGMQGYTGEDASVRSTPGFLTPGTTVPEGTGGLPPLTGGSTAFGSGGAPSVPTTPSGPTAFGASAAPVLGEGQGGIESAKDFLAMNNVTLGTDLTGLSENLAYSDMGQKLSSMGASFEDPDTAARMFESMGLPPPDEIELYNGPTSPAVSMGGLQINTMTGQGTGLAGLPNTRDFFPACAGTPEIDTVYDEYTAGGVAGINLASCNLINDQVNLATSLLDKAGIDIDNPPAKNLGHTMTFGTNLHRYGADDLNNPANTTAFGASQAPGEPRGGYAGIDGIDDFGKSVTDMVNTDLLSGFMGTGDVLRDMANTSNKYGQSITASLAEGKNKAVMQQNGIMPLNYGPNIGKV